MSKIQAEIEARLAEVEPEVEVLLAEVVGGGLLRLFIDHPNGVSLELCERVTNHPSLGAGAVRARGFVTGHGTPTDQAGALPALRRPPRQGAYARQAGDAPARRSFTGELLNATEDTVTVAADTGVVSIPYTDIDRSNLVGD